MSTLQTINKIFLNVVTFYILHYIMFISNIPGYITSIITDIYENNIIELAKLNSQKHKFKYLHIYNTLNNYLILTDR